MRIPRPLLVSVLAVPMIAVAHSAAADTTVQVDGTSATLTFTVASAAPYVQFYFDGKAVGMPAATSSGSASTTLESWGYSNSAHQVTAADCSGTATCAPTPNASGSVTLDNIAPTITSPAADTPVLGGFHVTATNPGGGLKYSVDGTRFDFDGGSPYDGHYQGSAPPPGIHTVTVTQCNTARRMCAGPTDAVDVVAELQPTITALAPNPFSPKHHRAVLSYTIQDTEAVTVTVRDSAGHAVRGPLDLGTRSGGAHSWSWSGSTNAGPVAKSGRYRIVLAASREAGGVTVHGTAAKAVTLDSTTPALTHVTGAATFYPVRDRYRDTFTATARLSEAALVTLHVRTAGGRPVRVVEATRKAGRAALTWNGRNGGGRIVPAGTYRWYLTARDTAGNTARSAPSTVTVSSSRLVSHVLSLVHNGADAVSTTVSDHSCGETSRQNSDYPNGLWLVNGCYQSASAETVAASFRFAVPRATRYDRLATTVDGYSLFAPSRVHTAYRDAATGKWDDGNLMTIRTSRQGLHALGTQTGAQHVGTGRVVTVSVVVDNADAPCDLDIARLLLRLRYSVLTPRP